MTVWKSPGIDDLKSVISAADKTLLICSPYVSSPGIQAVEEALPDSVEHIDVWTKLSTEDWLVGASQPERLLEFVDYALETGRSVAIRQSRRLHAKIVLSDGPQGIAGSANLTGGGYGKNIEVVSLVTGSELVALREFTDSIRSQLSNVTLDQFREFVRQCLAKIDSQEALLDLIRNEMPPIEISPQSLIPYKDYLDYLSQSSGSLAQDILRIARNIDGNNNTGKVKHAFYGVQRFLQEYPHHESVVAQLPENEWFEIGESSLWPDWQKFLADYENEESDSYQYRMSTLINTYLPVASGGASHRRRRWWQ